MRPCYFNCYCKPKNKQTHTRTFYNCNFLFLCCLNAFFIGCRSSSETSFAKPTTSGIRQNAAAKSRIASNRNVKSNSSKMQKRTSKIYFSCFLMMFLIVLSYKGELSRHTTGSKFRKTIIISSFDLQINEF